ncbi:MAG: hypothetical protein ABWX74_12465 [Aeromicrobium sp.]
MTTSELAGIMRRRWYVVALGVVLLAGALHVVASRPGVYWAQVDVVILAPKSTRFPNVIEQTSQSIIAMAGLVERDVNKGVEEPATASASASLAGMGVRDGYLVRLPNSGGQWANNFDRPVVDVQVVGPDETVVRARLVALVDDVERALAARQTADGVAPKNRITASSTPAAAPVFYMDGNPKKALLVTLLLGGGLISAGTVGADRLLTAHARRRRALVMVSRLGRIA